MDKTKIQDFQSWLEKQIETEKEEEESDRDIYFVNRGRVEGLEMVLEELKKRFPL